MADLLDQQHVDAGLSLLRADALLTVYPDSEGFTPVNPALPYVRVYTTIERPADSPGNALDGRSAEYVTRWTVHCVAANENAAVAVAMRVRAALLDVRPTIAGRNCGLIRQDQAVAPFADDSTGTRVYDAVNVYKLVTH